MSVLCKNKKLQFSSCYIYCNFARPKWEGGRYEGDEDTRLEALHLAHELGADYIDFELKVAFEILFWH